MVLRTEVPHIVAGPEELHTVLLEEDTAEERHTEAVLEEEFRTGRLEEGIEERHIAVGQEEEHHTVVDQEELHMGRLEVGIDSVVVDHIEEPRRKEVDKTWCLVPNERAYTG